MKRIRATGAGVIALGGFLLMLGSVLSAPAGAAIRLHDIEYAVMSAVIEHGIGPDTESVVIDATTTGAAVDFGDPARPESDLAADLRTTVRALREWSRANQRTHQLESAFRIPAAVTLLSEAARADIFGADDPALNWNRFRTRHPDAGGIIRLSRPGIDEVANVAVVYLEFDCGAECGSGRLVNVVRNESGIWTVTTGTLMWMASPD